MDSEQDTDVMTPRWMSGARMRREQVARSTWQGIHQPSHLQLTLSGRKVNMKRKESRQWKNP